MNMEKIELEKIREKIDQIDEKIVQLLEERFDIVEKVAQYKKENNKNIYDEKREKEVIKKILNKIKNNKLEKYIKNIYEIIMENSKKYQKDKIEKMEE